MRLTGAEFQATKEKVEKIMARAVKRGFTGQLTVTGEWVEVTTTLPNGLEVKEQMVDTEITGTPPKYDGWTFLATLDWDENSGLVVRSAPGAPVIDRSGLRKGECDHCQTTRNRKNIFVVADEAGKQIQVGSTCLKDFLGWDAMPVWIPEDDISPDSLFGDGGYGYADPSYSVDTVLAAAWATIQEFGYFRADHPAATKYTVHTVLRPRSAHDRVVSEQVAPHIPDSAAQAKLIRDWVLSDDFSGPSDYVANLKTIAKGEFVSSRNFGFLVSAPMAWARAVERDLRKAAERADTLDEWNGQVGDKLALTVTLKGIRPVESDWGTSQLYTFVDAEGRTYKWFSTRVIWREIPDHTVNIVGTVKRLDSYQGHKQTMLTRVKVL